MEAETPKHKRPTPRSMENNTPDPQSEERKHWAWNKHRKCLLALLFLVALLFATAIGFGFYSQQRHRAPTTPVAQAPPPCRSPACQAAAVRLSAAADPFSQPCDYFLLACGAGGAAAARGRQRGKGIGHHDNGGQERKRGAKDGEGGGEGTDGETDMRRKSDSLSERWPDRQTGLLLNIRDVLESPGRPLSQDAAGQKARRFYRTCMDTQNTERLGSQPFLTLIEQLGGWPVSGAWGAVPDLNSTLSLLMRDYSTFPFFSVYVGPDPTDLESSRGYIQIDQPDLLLPIEWNNKTQKSIANPKALHPFHSSCLQLLSLLGVRPSSTGLHNGLYMALSSELALASSPLHYRLHNRLLYQRITIRELQTLAPAIDWLGCLQATFHPLPIGQSDVVLLHNVHYITHMSRTISKRLHSRNMMDSGSLHTYMILSLLQTLIPALDSRFTQTQRNFSVALGNREKEVPRWRQCVLKTEIGFDSALSHMIRERTVQREAEELMHDVFSSFKTRLADLEWQDEESRVAVMNKVRSLTPRLSTKADILSQAKLNQLYSEVVIGEEDYFSNYLQLLLLQQRRRNRLLSQSAPADILSIAPFLSGDDIIFPIGMFAPPLFHPTYPRAVNYGVLGFLMAKDLLHLLLPNIHSQSMASALVSECVWSQYLLVTEGPGRVGAFPLSPAQQQEAWVQHSALQVALQAYTQSLLKRQGDTSLSGLSHAHLFLASFAQVSCDSDPYSEFMPFEPSFLVTVICANSDLCPTPMTCPNKPQLHSSQKC